MFSKHAVEIYGTNVSSLKPFSVIDDDAIFGRRINVRGGARGTKRREGTRC